MGIGGVASVALGVQVFALLSKRLEGSIVTPPTLIAGVDPVVARIPDRLSQQACGGNR